MSTTDRHGHETAGRPSSSGRAVDAETVEDLRQSYGQLVKAGGNSVRAAWRFGQTINTRLTRYTMAELAASMGRSPGTLNRYHRLFSVYQRAEAAVEASVALETANIDLIYALQSHMMPVEHRSLVGRRWRSRCQTCQSTDVRKEEITDPAELAELDGQAKAAAGAN